MNIRQRDIRKSIKFSSEQLKGLAEPIWDNFFFPVRVYPVADGDDK